MRGGPPELDWVQTAGQLLRAHRPFGEFEAAYRRTYADRDVRRLGPGPAWLPDPSQAEGTNVGRWMAETGAASFQAFHAWSSSQRDEFWLEILRRTSVKFRKAPRSARDPHSDARSPAWLPGALLNIAETCLLADGVKTAILYGREGSSDLRRITYDELRRLSLQVAAGLDRLGLDDRDRVALYLPMTPESVAAYLGIILSGRAVVGIADASASADVEKRVRISDAKAVITIDAYLRDGKRLAVYEKAKAAQAPTTIVLPAEAVGQSATPLRHGDQDWDSFLGQASQAKIRVRSPEDETNILFSSGTTKDPKALVWTHTTPIKCLADAYVHQDVRPDDVLAWPTSYGWMMGPWLTYAGLGRGATIALYGGSPLLRSFGQFVADSHTTLLGVVPKLVSAWKAGATMEGLDWSRIRRFSSTGETSNPNEMLYLMWLAGNKPVIEYCGGTEIGGGYVTGSMVQPAAPSAFTTAACGLDFHILDDAGRPAARGEVALVPPSIGLSNHILNYDHETEYFAGFYRGPSGELLRRHGDQMELLGGGFLRHHGRIDDMINLNGVKTSVEELRAAIGAHALVSDTKPIAVDVDGSGQRVLVVYAVPRDAARLGDSTLGDRLRKDFSDRIKAELSPLLSRIHDVVLVAELPQAGPGKTRTQKEFAKDYASRAAAAR